MNVDARVFAAIRRHPGERADQIAARLSCHVADVSAALRRLQRDKRVKGRGQTRGRTYRA